MTGSSGVAMAPLFVVPFAVRAGIEERALIARLPEYADCTARVRYRLVPGLRWGLYCP